MKKVIAVVVTYNRINLLKECLQALQAQIVDLDTQLETLIVDNASTDGTKEWIDDVIRQKNSHETGMHDGNVSDRKIYAEYLAENTGGAGGFYAGMKWAYEHGADAIWIMDDDTIPQADALQKLLDGMVCAGNEAAPQGEIGFVSSTVLWTDGSPCQMNRQHYVGEETHLSFPADSMQSEQEERPDRKQTDTLTLQAVDSATFVSLLFTRTAVENKGLPVKEYFIWGDDKEYTLRVSETYSCYHVKESVVIHKMKNNSGSNIVIDDIGRVPRYFYAFRNDLCTAKRRGTKEVCIYFVAFFLNMLRVLFKSRDGKKARIATMWKGMTAGMRFAPEIGGWKQ